MYISTDYCKNRKSLPNAIKMFVGSEKFTTQEYGNKKKL